MQGRCYDPCTSDDGCVASEQCQGGACVPRGAFDAGVDAGPPCMGACPPHLCHPLANTCVGCTLTQEVCGGGASTCDIARGNCIAPSPVACAPCRISADCNDGVNMGECVSRSFFDRGPFERVCLLPCGMGDTCATGYECRPVGAGRLCIPVLGLSCTSFIAGVSSRTCASDADCAPLGAQSSDILLVGACNTATGQCLQPCSMPADPCLVPGTVCMGMGVQFYCRPP